MMAAPFRKNILLVEDDPTLGEGLQSSLSKTYNVKWANTLAKATHLIKTETFDLLICDLGLPDGNGMDLVESIQNLTYRPPVLILSAQGDPETRLKGYEIGIQEFVPKPFHLKELLLRIGHVFEAHANQIEFEVGKVKINFATFAVYLQGGAIEYPPVNDIKILKHLTSQAGNPVSRDQLIDVVWGADSETSHRTIDNSIARLRQLVGDTDEQIIRSVRGVGYVFENKSSGEKI
jgi:DNA-binding response OmpR family regulator